jgi:hypothetical protein
VTDFIDGLEQDLVEAAHRRSGAPSAATAARVQTPRRRRRRRPPLRTLLIATTILALSAGSAAAGTLLVLRGSAIPAPAPRDVPPEQTPVPSSSQISSQRAEDPGAAPPWALRVARSRTGFVCSTVGQVDDGTFGLVGLDNRFRAFDEGVVDGCGQERTNAASLVGARVFDATRSEDVRTIVNGVGGDTLRKVTLDAGGTQRDVPVGDGGVFIAALRGYPEDIGVAITLRFADDHVERHAFGTSEFVVPDPAGGRAWRVEAIQFGVAIPQRCRKPGASRKSCAPDPNGSTEVCVRFRPARDVVDAPFSEAVCGSFANAGTRAGYFFGVRREEPGRAHVTGDLLGADWKQHPPRTAVFGIAGEDVAGVEVDGPGARKQLSIASSRAFLALYGPDVKPGQLTVRVTMRDGAVKTHRGDTHLVTPRRRP